jgi:hypothetical protein
LTQGQSAPGRTLTTVPFSAGAAFCFSSATALAAKLTANARATKQTMFFIDVLLFGVSKLPILFYPFNQKSQVMEKKKKKKKKFFENYQFLPLSCLKTAKTLLSAKRNYSLPRY